MQSSSSHSSSSSSSSSSSHSNSSSSAASSSLSLKLRVDLNVRKQQPWYIALDQALLEEEDWLLERDDRNAAQRALRSAWRAFQPATSLERAKEIFATIRTVIDDADCSDDYVFKYLMTLANSQLQISDDKWFIKFLKKLQGVLALSPELTALQAEERAMMIAQIDAAVEAALKRFLEKTEKGVGADSGGKENHVARRNGAGTINPGGSAMNASSSASSSAPTTGALTVVPQRNVNASSSAGATQPSTASSSAGVSQSSSSSSAQGTVASMLNAHSSLTTPHASGATSSGGSKAQPEPSASNSGTSKKFADLPTGFWAFTQQAAATAQQPKASDDQNSQNPAPILADRNPMPYVGFSFTSSSHSSS